MEIEFYRSKSGKSRVYDFILKSTRINAQFKKKLNRILERIDLFSDFNSLNRSMKEIKELRLKGINNFYQLSIDAGKIWFRLLFCVEEEVVYFLHGFKKKKNNTDSKEIKIALENRSKLYGN